MNLTDPIRSIIPSSHGPILQVLAATTAPLTGRTVASLTDGQVSQRQTSTVLRELVDSGLVTVQRHPPSNLYLLNRDHVAADAVIELASLRKRLMERLRTGLGRWNPAPEQAWLFGSFSRGEGDNTSDIDVLVIRPDGVDSDDPAWSDQVLTFSNDVLRWSGNRCNVIEYSRSEFDASARFGAHLVDDVVRDGVVLAGPPIHGRGESR